MWMTKCLVVVVVLSVQNSYARDTRMSQEVRDYIESYKVAAAKAAGLKVSKENVSDILDKDEQLDVFLAKRLVESLDARQKRKAMNFADSTFTKYKWPDAPIPYNVDANVDAEGAAMIVLALNHVEAETCIRFSATESPSDNYVHFKTAASSISNVGRNTEELEQVISLSSVDIRNKGEIVHQVLHALGMWHEHQRPDRDAYIEIMSDNFEANEEGDFKAIPAELIDTANLPYDYSSLMHFHAKTRSINDQPTLKTKDPLYQMAIGQRSGLSFLDSKLINTIYCSEKCSSTSPSEPCQHGGYADPNNCSACTCPDGFGGNYCEELAPSVGVSCGGEMDAIPKEQSITSPGYDTAYDYNQECTWRIKAPTTGHVEVKFDGDFTIFSPGGMCQHWVAIRYKSQLGEYGPRFCGNEKPSSVLVSEGEELLILFRAKYQNTQLAESSTGLKGFKLIYKAVDVTVSPCEDITCQNGGQCSEMTYTCECPAGYSGDLCEKGDVQKTPCNPDPCVNGGFCQVVGTTYSCSCPDPFTGTNCEKEGGSVVSLCSPDPCVNGGTCQVNGTSYSCECLEPFEGEYCEKASCGGCGVRAGAYAMPCYGDNSTSNETCRVLKEYTYECRGWWGRKCRCTGYHYVDRDCVCCENATLVDSNGGEHLCAVTGWSDWGECSETCGGGQQYKLRYTVTNYETWTGRSYRQLVVAEEEPRECNMQECSGFNRWWYGPHRSWGHRCCSGYYSYGGICRR